MNWIGLCLWLDWEKNPFQWSEHRAIPHKASLTVISDYELLVCKLPLGIMRVEQKKDWTFPGQSSIFLQGVPTDSINVGTASKEILLAFLNLLYFWEAVGTVRSTRDFCFGYYLSGKCHPGIVLQSKVWSSFLHSFRHWEVRSRKRAGAGKSKQDLLSSGS